MGDSPLIDYISHRVTDQNKNFIAVITGPTGSGKSYTAIRLGELLGEALNTDFNIDHVCFRPRNLIKLINDGDLSQGSVLVLDEAGVAMNSRKWQSKMNVLMSYLLQTYRHMNLITFMCLPHFEYLDRQARELVHAVFETDYIDYEKETAWIKPLLVQVNQRTGKMYHKYLRVREDGEKYKVDRAGFTLASEDLLEAYEQKKADFTEELNKDIEQELEAEAVVSSDEKEELTEQQRRVLELSRNGHSQREIGEVLDMNVSLVNRQLHAAKEKVES